MDNIFSFLNSIIGTGIAILLVITVYLIVQSIFRRQSKKNSASITRQFVLTLIVLFGLLIIVITLPIEEGVKGQIISLIGIVVSAAFALSSTTLLGNLMAGLMNRSNNSFKIGDFIRCNELFGRVINKGLFQTQIQTEDRNLTTIPNIYLVGNPVKVLRDPGTIISSTVSLGYDVSRLDIEKALLQAASKCGLKEAFVYIQELGDFSVVYKVHGLLEETNKFFSTKARLNALVIDSLHEYKIEIVSPTFMNTRQVNKKTFIPKSPIEGHSNLSISSPEDLMFDKAIEAESVENKQLDLAKLEEFIPKVKEKIKKAPNKEQKLHWENRLKRLEDIKIRTIERIEEEKKKLDKK